MDVEDVGDVALGVGANDDRLASTCSCASRWSRHSHWVGVSYVLVPWFDTDVLELTSSKGLCEEVADHVVEAACASHAY